MKRGPKTDTLSTSGWSLMLPFTNARLGIDIGDLDLTLHVGIPHTVAPDSRRTTHKHTHLCMNGCS